MGFYGNITNTAKTQFQFDRIYSSRYEMEKNKYNDGIYAGRYVLVEYDEVTHLDTFKQVQIKNGLFYYNPEGETSFQTLLTKANIGYGELVYTAETKTSASEGYQPKDCVFYICTSDLIPGSEIPAEFELIVSGSADMPNYTYNYNIDIATFGAGRGYDSTVWQKVYSDGIERYVMIAELNTVVPTFDVSADAPTMTPLVPHFDLQSTDVYYKLHWQAPWGFRVKEASVSDPSDEVTIHTTTTYNPETGENTESSDDVRAAIYYNAAAFNPQVNSENTTETVFSKHSNVINEIKVEASGKSGNKYNKHNGITDTEEKIDIQEMTIHLPVVGNMVSDVWDIVHGPLRNDARTDENSSLQGRLDSFKEIEENQIPVKRAGDGTLVGSKINNAIAYDVWEGKMAEILEDNTDPAFERDDAWIKTVINTSELVGGIVSGDIVDQSNNSGISIHHTFHATENSTSTVDKNTGGTTNSDTYKSTYIKSSNVAHNVDDMIELYVPYIDAKGHVVGHNIETITLPYGYKTIKTNGRSDEVSENATGKPETANIVADTTQDALTINSGNKWIRIDTDVNNDTLTIRHDVHNIDVLNDSEPSLSSEESKDIKFTIPQFEWDKAGHITKNGIITYTMPFGYGKIKGDDGATEATATYDELTFGSDDWLTATVSIDKVVFSHDYPKKIDDTTSEQDMNDNKKDTIILETLERDAKGHVIKVNQNTVTLPYGYKTFTGDSGSSSADNTQDSMAVNGDDWIKTTVSNDNILITHTTPVTGTSTSASTFTPNFGGEFKFNVYDFDARGHKFNTTEHTVKIPEPSLTTTGEGNVVIGLSLASTSGAFTETKKNLGELAITGYSKPTTLSIQSLEEKDSLNNALGKIEYKLDKEISEERNQAIKDAIDNLNFASEAQKGFYITSVKQTAGAIEALGFEALPTYILQTGSTNGTVKFNGVDVAVKGLGSAAYENKEVFAANDILETTTFDYKVGESVEQKTISQLFAIVAELTTELNALKAKVNTEHPEQEVIPPVEEEQEEPEV